MKSWKWALFRISVVLQIDRELLDLAEEKAGEGVPVAAPWHGRQNRLLNVNAPVGDGGWRTLSRAHRSPRPS